MTDDTVPLNPGDLAPVAADDALLDALASGTPAAGTTPDAVVDLMARWRNELDDRAAGLPAYPMPSYADSASAGSPSPPRRRARAHRRTAAVAALGLALATSTGVAAAAGGPTGPLAPLHNFFFGGSSHSDHNLAQASALLERAAADITAARAAGGVNALQRSQISALLDRADALLSHDAGTHAALDDKVSALRAALAALPSLPAPGRTEPGDVASSPDRHGGTGSEPGDDHGAGEPGDDNGDGSGDDRGGSGGSADDGGTQGDGSDDSNTTSHSGDGGGDQSGAVSGDTSGSSDSGSGDSSGSGDDGGSGQTSDG